MKWQNKELTELTKDELYAAIISVGEMDGYRVDKLSQFRKRHIKVFEKHPPVENPTFIQLVEALNQEYKSRK